jgi:hypothetical protein
MKYLERGDLQIPTVELTRRNLRALLAKLDGNPPDSMCTIVDPYDQIAVKAVEDSEHYADRSPGPMTPETEEVLAYGPGQPCAQIVPGPKPLMITTFGGR